MTTTQHQPSQSNLDAVLHSVRQATAKLHSALQDLDAKEAELAGRIARIETAPPSRAEFIAYVCTGLQEQGQRWKQELASGFSGGLAGHQLVPLEIAAHIDAAGVETLKTTTPRPINVLVDNPQKPGALFAPGRDAPGLSGRVLAAVFADLLAPRLESILAEMELPFPDQAEVPLVKRPEVIQQLRSELTSIREQRKHLAQQMQSITEAKLAPMFPSEGHPVADEEPAPKPRRRPRNGGSDLLAALDEDEDEEEAAKAERPLN